MRLTLLAITILILTGCGTSQEPMSEPDITNEIPVEGASAHWVSASHLLWETSTDAASYALYYSSNAALEIFDAGVIGGNFFRLTPGGNLDPDLADKLRHIADWPIFSLSEDESSLKDALRGQLVAVAFDDAGVPIKATHVQRHGVLDDLYTFDGDLGLVYNDDSIKLNLWAPTAQSVTLVLYNSEKEKVEEVEPSEYDSEHGVWTFSGPLSWDRLFYQFNIQVYHRENDQINNYLVTDPYSVSLAVDSEFSQFADLKNDSDLKPTGWDELIKELPFPTDITLYEAHMRDFSIIDQTVPEEHRGTYMAFTHNGENGSALSDGMNHLMTLAKSGLTHLHLLPINDITTVNENKEDRIDLHHPFSRLCDFFDDPMFTEYCDRFDGQTIREAFVELSEDDPTTKAIQEIYLSPEPSDKFSDYDGFNWGYDPFHFNTPEGSYSTDPDGAQRLLETRKMVKALHEIGLNIVVDVVYNHTSASGLSNRSVLDRVVPDYFQRLNPYSGDVENSTCCPNTAAEFNMMEKLIIDSILHWAKFYKIDSFRFDLMGHHPKYVMENLLSALETLTVEEHGVDGKNIFIYGEGWNFGEVADNRIFDQATQFMTGGTGIGHFNDRIRDAVKGGFHSWTGRDQGFANGKYLYPNEDFDQNEQQKNDLLSQADRIRVGMTGNLSTYPYINRFGELVDGGNEMIGFARMPQESINYLDKHDNETLWDNTQTKLPDWFSMDDRVRVHNQSNAFINYGQGIPFYQLGTEILRSKSMDRNSYDSGDWYNAIDYTLETNNWGIGLPFGRDNEERWDEQAEILLNENISITKEHMEFAQKVFHEQLQIRYSSSLFRLREADDVHRRVAYHNTGPDQIPGIIAMTISDGMCAGESLDENYDGLLVLFNSHIESHTIDLNLPGMVLHPLHLESADSVVKEVSIHEGSFVIPPLTAAVLVKPMGTEQGEFICNGIK